MKGERETEKGERNRDESGEDYETRDGTLSLTAIY